MIRSYLTTALRALRRNWNYTVINVVGLTFGLACCLLLFLAIRYELSYDRHNTHADRTYRLVQRWQGEKTVGYNPGIPLPMLAALRTDFPEMAANVTMIHEIANVVVRANTPNQNKFEEPGGIIAFAESAYFRLFDYPWLRGSAETSLRNPNTVVLTERMAKKYFGTTDAMGKTLRVNNRVDFTVTGIVGEPPATSSVPFEILLSWASLKSYGAYTGWDDWQSTYTGLQLYLLLPQPQFPTALERNLVGFVKKHHSPDEVGKLTYTLQPLTAIHTDTDTSNYAGRSVSPEMIGSMALIGLFILLTACVNFVNLATAQAIRRAKEVGVRKVLGSSRGQLVRQFLGETGLLTALSIGLSLAVAALALPYVTELRRETRDCGPIRSGGAHLPRRAGGNHHPDGRVLPRPCVVGLPARAGVEGQNPVDGPGTTDLAAQPDCRAVRHLAGAGDRHAGRFRTNALLPVGRFGVRQRSHPDRTRARPQAGPTRKLAEPGSHVLGR